MAAVGTYRGYTHADNELNLVAVEYQTRYSPRMRKLTETRRMRIRGELTYTGTSSIVQKANEIINAYSQDYGDFTFTVGGVPAHQLLNSGDCISGVKVVNKSFPSGNPDELATVRTFSATLQATYNVCEDNLVQWNDALSVTGTGGPLKTIVNTIYGPLQIYYSISSGVYVRQSGSAIGFNDYPNPPAPIGNADAEFSDRHNITQISGTQQGTGIKFFKTSWSYQFAFSFLSGFVPISK